ncbi:protein DWD HYPERSENSITIVE TO UV-B 1-like isoform X1 [Silene latifolia]|uniref:protein DWD HYPERSENSITIVE TO UV-B 1-like isoform X1 n=2 Tax=Silene latifolia TaxID=37657 RepID=UPI003D77913D
MENNLEFRYIRYCTRYKVLPVPAISDSLTKADNQRSRKRRSSLKVELDQLKDADYLPLIDLINAMCSSDLDAINICNESPCIIDENQTFSLMCAANQKLHAVCLHDLPFTKHFLRDMFRSGLSCRVLKLSTSSLHKLEMVGNFKKLRKLNLDFCTSLTTIQKDPFSQMPNLMHLSMCETRLSNLWTTTAALSKLPSLIELRFQNCLCCQDTGPCPAYSGNDSGFHVSKNNYHAQETSQDFLVLEDSSPNYEDQFESLDVHSSELQRLSLLDLSSNSPDYLIKELPSMIQSKELQVKSSEQGFGQETQEIDHSEDFKSTTQRKYISHHPSPLCFEKHYREFILSSLPQLLVLDNLPVGTKERKIARVIYSKHFEYLPYKRQQEVSVPRILHHRELASRALPCRIPSVSRKSSVHQRSFSKSLLAAKLGASPWPQLHRISEISSFKNEESKIFRPRQFEYHPSNSSLMAFGTLDGEVVVINHENQKQVAYMPNFGASTSILGLCWLKKHPSKVLVGSDNGLLRLYDINDASSKGSDSYHQRANSITFDSFEQLTSVHINSTDELCVVSGCTKNVAMYDMGTGKRFELFNNLHQEPINVAKFANHSPFMFATSSFDRKVKMWDLRQGMIRPCYSAISSRGNVMACFSPDDHYLLVSAVDNEVKQLLAADGRLNIDFGIASSGSSHNYTRSYYMNGGDYIISGSSDEHVVRVCCAQTGRRLRDVHFEGRVSDKSMFVQSLRSDPFREFNMSILASYGQSNSKCEIIKVNLLASNEDGENDVQLQRSCSSFSLGG